MVARGCQPTWAQLICVRKYLPTMGDDDPDKNEERATSTANLVPQNLMDRVNDMELAFVSNGDFSGNISAWYLLFIQRVR